MKFVSCTGEESRAFEKAFEKLGYTVNDSTWDDENNMMYYEVGESEKPVESKLPIVLGAEVIAKPTGNCGLESRGVVKQINEHGVVLYCDSIKEERNIYFNTHKIERLHK